MALRTTRNVATGATYEREPFDFYREQTWAVKALFKREPIHGTILDPFCGLGRIPLIARQLGYVADGSDIQPRAPEFEVRDFLLPPAETQRKTHDWVFSNPIYNTDHTAQIVDNALLTARIGVALLFPATILETPDRARFWERAPLARIYVSASRMAMPPGSSGKEPDEEKGGTRMFIWLVLRHDWDDEPRTRWLYR